MPLPWSVWVYESSRLEGPLSWELDGERGHPTGRLLSLKKVVRRRGTIFFCFLLFMFTELFCSCCILVLPHVATLFLANALMVGRPSRSMFFRSCWTREPQSKCIQVAPMLDPWSCPSSGVFVFYYIYICIHMLNLAFACFDQFPCQSSHQTYLTFRLGESVEEVSSPSPQPLPGVLGHDGGATLGGPAALAVYHFASASGLKHVMWRPVSAVTM